MIQSSSASAVASHCFLGTHARAVLCDVAGRTVSSSTFLS